MKKLWKIIKENITVVLAMTTAFLSVVYAGIRLMIYVYWMGYFKELNIDANVMNINYEGNLFQVIFLAGLLLLLFYVFAMMDEGFKKYSEAIKKEQQSKIKRIFAWSKMLWKCFWRSLFFIVYSKLTTYMGHRCYGPYGYDDTTNVCADHYALYIRNDYVLYF